MNTRWSLGVVSFLFACGGTEASGGAQEADVQGGYAWSGDYAVGLFHSKGGGVCTGTLIAPRLVLTAGHCVQDFERTLDAVYFGAGAPLDSADGVPSEIPPGMERYEIDDVALFPGYTNQKLLDAPTEVVDVGLVHLRDGVTGITPQRFVGVAEADAVAAALVPGTSCFISGYGRHDENGRTTVKEKRAGEVELLGFVGNTIRVRRGGEANGAITDEGDSGGPLLCAIAGLEGRDPWRVVGTVSFHDEEGHGDVRQESYFANVARASAWIEAAVDAFPTEERCTTTGGELAFSCAGASLRFCDGQRWQPAMTCESPQRCDAERAACVDP